MRQSQTQGLLTGSKHPPAFTIEQSNQASLSEGRNTSLRSPWAEARNSAKTLLDGVRVLTEKPVRQEMM